jgi:hypothetical protein
MIMIHTPSACVQKVRNKNRKEKKIFTPKTIDGQKVHIFLFRVQGPRAVAFGQ